jgi:hypothetical protein
MQKFPVISLINGNFGVETVSYQNCTSPAADSDAAGAGNCLNALVAG